MLKFENGKFTIQNGRHSMEVSPKKLYAEWRITGKCQSLFIGIFGQKDAYIQVPCERLLLSENNKLFFRTLSGDIRVLWTHIDPKLSPMPEYVCELYKIWETKKEECEAKLRAQYAHENAERMKAIAAREAEAAARWARLGLSRDAEDEEIFRVVANGRIRNWARRLGQGAMKMYAEGARMELNGVPMYSSENECCLLGRAAAKKALALR